MKVQFLGHIASKVGLEVDPSKMEAIQKFPVPRSQTEFQSFLGLPRIIEDLYQNLLK